METIYHYTESRIRIMQGRRKYETAKTYRTILNHLKRFSSDPDIRFADLTPGFLIDFQRYLANCGCSNNTRLLYFRQLQAIHRQAVRQRLTPAFDDLYADLPTKSDQTVKRSVSALLFKQLRDAVLPKKHNYLALSLDLFILSFYLRGIPYIDIAYLRVEDIKDNLLHYHRHKTGKKLTVTLEPCALEIINRWKQHTKDSPYLFPIIKNAGDEIAERRQYESGLRLHNKHLKKLVQVIGLPPDTLLTSYTPRHTWANLAHNDGVGLPFISEALSHSSEKTTRCYVRSFTADTLAAINRQVLGIIDRQSLVEDGIRKKSTKENREGFRLSDRTGTTFRYKETAKL